MKYQVVEQCEDGRVYAVVTRANGSTFGQLVDVAGARNAEEVDQLIVAAIVDAERRNAPAPALELREALVDQVLNVETAIAPAALEGLVEPLEPIAAGEPLPLEPL
jgi:hypothetical protein